MSIGTRFSRVMEDGITTYLLFLDASDQHPTDDFRERSLHIGRFAAMKVDAQPKLAEAFGVSLQTVSCALKLYRDQGSVGFFKPRRGRSKLDESVIKQAQQLLRPGKSGRQTARQLHIAPSTFSENYRAGAIVIPPPKTKIPAV